ncbi:MAG: hypothetical protein AB7L65_07945, partial [Hyphomonadaceae bacterium]
MRAPQLFGILLSAAAVLAAPGASAAVAANAPAVAATAPAHADPARTYDEPIDALADADLDYLVSDARKGFSEGDHAAARGLLVFLDAMTAARWRDARAVLTAVPEGLHSDLADLFEPFLLLGERRVDRALERIGHGGEVDTTTLPDIGRALILEGAGRLPQAADAYAGIEQSLDTRPPPDGEPQSAEDVTRILALTRTVTVLYRAALVNHRLHRTAEAQRLYGLVSALAPHSPDVAVNMRRLAEGRDPYEPALDARRALGRWLVLLADYMAQTEGLTAILQSEGPVMGLASPSAAMFLQFALLLDPAADDWRIYAATQLLDADGLDGAERLLAPIGPQSPYAAEAALTRAKIDLARRQDAAAATDAQQAVSLAGDRWLVLTSAGDIFRTVGRNAEAIATLNRAMAAAGSDKERADTLRYRAYAHRFAGDMADAVADARAALTLDQGVDTRLLYVSILMDDEHGWRDGVRVARTLFAEKPDSVTRLNTLGYALIQRPEGLQEGYRLLWRGFVLGEHDFAVVVSLGWAYYLYGAFDEARALVERANVLAGTEQN